MLQDAIVEAVETAGGRRRRTDEIGGRTGGPAGNALLTAWTGMVLLALFVAELVTLLDLSGWLDWHVVIGVLLVPPALVKTASTGWRIIRYYTGEPRYRRSGPPPMLLRVLGPLVVAATLALLGSGLLLVVTGPATAREPFLTMVGQALSLVTLHAGLAVVWAVVTGLHLLGRLVPAVLIVAESGPRIGRVRSRRRVPGAAGRLLVVVAALACALAALPLVTPLDPGWLTHREGPHKHTRGLGRGLGPGDLGLVPSSARPVVHADVGRGVG